MKNFTYFYNYGHKLRTKDALRLNIISVSNTRDMPYEEIYFQRLKEDNTEELGEIIIIQKQLNFVSIFNFVFCLVFLWIFIATRTYHVF